MTFLFSPDGKYRAADYCAVALIVVAMLFAVAPVKAQGKPPGDQHATTDIGKKELVLSNLYQQLANAQDKQNAEFISAAIQRLWLKSGSETVDILMSRAVHMIQEKELDLALEILDAVVEIAPKYTEGWNQRATVHFLKRDYEDSLGDLRRVLAIEPRHYRAVNGLGLILQELGEKSAALKAYRRALQLNPFLSETKRSIKELRRDVEGQGI